MAYMGFSLNTNTINTTNMTIRELENQLNLIEDNRKDLQVYIYNPLTTEVFEIESIDNEIMDRVDINIIV